MKKDWEIKKLGDICEFRRGLTYSKNDEVENSSNAVLRSNNIDLITNQLDLSEIKYISDKIKIDETKKVKRNSLLICTANGSKAHLGKVALIDDDYDFAFGGFMGLLIPSESIYPRFFYYALISENYKKFIKSLSDGANINNLKFQDLSNFEIPVPPLEEQKRIVKILDEKFAQLESLKANAQTNLQNAKDLFQSQLAKAFSNTTWEKKAIGEVCSKKENIKWKNENVSTEYQYIDLSAVDRESKNISDTQIITKESAPSRAQQIVKTGDILFGTTRPTLKRFCLLADEYDGQICSTGFCVIRPNQNIISSDWMFYQFYNDEFYKYIEPLQKGASYPAVTDKEVLNYEIPLPPLEEQKRIVAHLDSLSEKVHQLEEIYTKQLADCDELKQAYLQKAFEGDL